MRLLPVVLAGLLGTALTVTGGSPATAAPAYTCHGHAATIVGTDGGDTITGTPGDDVIVALYGEDTVHGGAGDDVICGDDGSDTLYGDAGDDQLYGGTDLYVDGVDNFGNPYDYDYGDELDGGPGDDLLAGNDLSTQTPSDKISYYGSAHGVTVDLVRGRATGDGNDTILTVGLGYLEGSEHDDRLFGSAGDDHLSGDGGNDLLVGRGGNDSLEDIYPPSSLGGDDTFRGGPGRDSIRSAEGSDDIHGGPGRDHIEELGDLGRDRIFGGGGKDVIRTVVSARYETVFGGRGRDGLHAYATRDAMRSVHLTCRSIEKRHAHGHC